MPDFLTPHPSISTARRQGIADLLTRSAQRYPNKTAIVFRGLRQSYRELDECVNRVANLLATRGIRPGERVALLSHNNHAFVVLYLAMLRLGVISVPINFMLQADEVAYILEHSGAVGIIVEDALQSVAQSALQAGVLAQRVVLRAIIETQGRPPEVGWESVQSWYEHPDSSQPSVDVGDDDPIQLLYTSGTESRPKGAVLSSRSLIAQYGSCISDGDMVADDIEVHAMPLFHCAQLHCFLSVGLYLGSTNILLPGPKPEEILDAVERERASKLFCPPTVWIALLRHPDFQSRDLSSLRKGYYGASIMPTEIIRELARRLPAVGLYNFYGQTEMGPLATVLRPADQVRKIGSAGRAALNVETRVVDEEDQALPADVVGEIVHRSPHAFLGYWNDAAKSAEAFKNGWLHSGDLGRMDAEGYLYVVDRKKDMIKTGGENVASREIEEIIYQHPGVAEVAVFGVLHPKWIEAVVAAIVPRAGDEIGEEALIVHCRERLAAYKTPKRVLVLDKLPKNASGKILKRSLRETFGALFLT